MMDALRGAGRVAMLALAFGTGVFAECAEAKVENMTKIDVHHHIYPPMLQEAIKEAGGEPALPPGRTWPWNLPDDNAFMKQIGVETVIFSVTTPGPLIKTDPQDQADLARACNEWIATEVRDSDWGRYGFYATVPTLQSPDLALAEIRYALDTLKADGVILLTQYGNGTNNFYLGSPKFKPVWKELSDRKAVVLVHPTMRTTDKTWTNAVSPPALYDYPQETARAVFDLIQNNVTTDYPDAKIVLSHAGGNFPWLMNRLIMNEFTAYRMGKTPEDFTKIIKKFYFDTALNGMNNVAINALLQIAEPDHILYGTDYPNAPAPFIGNSTIYFNQAMAMDVETKNSIYSGAAKQLFPRLQNEGGALSGSLFDSVKDYVKKSMPRVDL